MSFAAHDIIQIDSDDDSYTSSSYDSPDIEEEEGEEGGDSMPSPQLRGYLSVRAADLAAAGIAEGELELELQRGGGRERRRGGGSRPAVFSPLLPRSRPKQTPTPTPTPTPTKTKPKSKPIPKPKPKPKPKRDPDDMMVDATCIICYSATTDTVLIPCGHLVLCAVCCDAIGATEKKVPGPRTVKCPICRKLVLDRMQVYRC